MAREVTNVAASVRDRLLNLSRQTGRDFQLVLTTYALERLLYRLSVSPYRDKFILKGAMLFAAWLKDPLRPTRDLDLLGEGDPDTDTFAAAFRQIMSLPVADDGLVFDTDRVEVSAIRENASYGGIRVETTATLESARFPIRIDIGFGDAVTPAPQTIDYPTLLDLPAPNLLAYPPETVVAEKLGGVDLSRTERTLIDAISKRSSTPK